MSHWVIFENGKRGCVDRVEGEDIVTTAEKLVDSKVVSHQGLPYPASPRLNKVSKCPSFCITPGTCAGKNSCPRRYACSD